MKNKRGFTLIELLAVIIILAIIALIATPIVMRVIENSKKGAAERSAENYVHVVQTEVAALRTEETVLEGTYGIKENGNLCLDKTTTCNEAGEIKIEMTGKKPSGGTVVISNGKVQATGTSITVEEYTVTINASGSATAIKNESGSATATTRYYSWASSGSITEGLPSDADTDLSNVTIPNNFPFYLAFDSVDGESIESAYVCFVKTIDETPTEFCIQGGVAEELRAEVFTSNQGILDTAFPSACSLAEGYYYCNAVGLNAFAYSNGFVIANGGNARCYVFDGGNFECNGH